jgi:DnaJ-class molecular chaperone
MFLGRLGWYCPDHAIAHMISTGETLESDLEESNETDIRYCCVCAGEHTVTSVYQTQIPTQCNVCAGTGKYRDHPTLLCGNCEGNGFTLSSAQIQPSFHRVPNTPEFQQKLEKRLKQLEDQKHG